MKLTVEGIPAKSVSDFGDVERALQSLSSQGPHAFAILDDDCGSFIQVAVGYVICTVERRQSPVHVLEIAFLSTPKVRGENKQPLALRNGISYFFPDEMLAVADALTCFRTFFERDECPVEIQWRPKLS